EVDDEPVVARATDHQLSRRAVRYRQPALIVEHVLVDDALINPTVVGTRPDRLRCPDLHHCAAGNLRERFPTPAPRVDGCRGGDESAKRERRDSSSFRPERSVLSHVSPRLEKMQGE